MTNRLDEWVGRAWSILASLPGVSEVVAEQHSHWNTFRHSEHLELVVFGAYDAGKSTLLKRLLVEWNVVIPEWLTISGRRETFEAKKVVANGFGFVDTPGLGSGNREHDDLTLKALRLADAYLWVLPPQLVTTGKEAFLEALTGRQNGTGISDATIGVIARMDEAGIDPADNPEGFKELCRRKMEEFTSLLELDGTKVGIQATHCVVADPYQTVGNMLNPDRELYDIGREWDGIDALVQEFAALRNNSDRLRKSAGARFVALLAKDVRSELQQLLEELTLSKEGLGNEVTRHKLFEQRLDALQRQARAELHRSIEDALLSVTRSGGDTTPDTIRSLEESLGQVIDVWSEASFAGYRRLAEDLELEAREHMAGPSMEGFRRLAEEAEAPNMKPKVDPLKVGRKVLGFGPELRKAFERYAAAELGMPLKVAAEQLQKLESSAETVEAFINSQGRRAAFRGAEHAKKASQFVKWGSVLEAVGPVVEQLGGVLIEVAGEVMSERRAKERAQQRLELRRQLRAEAEKLEGEAALDFDATCEGLRKWIANKQSLLAESREKLLVKIEQHQSFIGKIDNLLENWKGDSESTPVC